MCSRRRAVNVFRLCIDSGDESGACMCDGSLVALFVSGGSFTFSTLCERDGHQHYSEVDGEGKNCSWRYEAGSGLESKGNRALIAAKQRHGVDSEVPKQVMAGVLFTRKQVTVKHLVAVTSNGHASINQLEAFSKQRSCGGLPLERPN